MLLLDGGSHRPASWLHPEKDPLASLYCKTPRTKPGQSTHRLPAVAGRVSTLGGVSPALLS